MDVAVAEMAPFEINVSDVLLIVLISPSVVKLELRLPTDE